MTGHVSVPISKAAAGHSITVEVTGIQQFKVRMNLTIWLLRLASMISPVTMTVEAK